MSRPSSPRSSFATALGAFYLVMAGINIGLVVGDSSVYRHFADKGLFPFVRTGWRDIVMAHPGVWIGLLAAGEIAIGLAFLARGSWPRAAYVAAVCFHLALMLFGWGVWLWAVPALALLVYAARTDDRPATSVEPRSDRWNEKGLRPTDPASKG
jgi:hypothetical protein